jgi:hypothetical protein
MHRAYRKTINSSKAPSRTATPASGNTLKWKASTQADALIGSIFELVMGGRLFLIAGRTSRLCGNRLKSRLLT